jgi:hypothetical protein
MNRNGIRLMSLTPEPLLKVIKDRSKKKSLDDMALKAKIRFNRNRVHYDIQAKKIKIIE